MRRWISLATACLVVLSLGGCASVGYVSQAAAGQVSLLLSARPIPQVVHDRKTPPKIRALLAELNRVRAFGQAHGLTPTKSYQSYVDLDRPAVVWVVSASKPLRFESKVWNFPIVGAFPYLGWFDRAAAERFGNSLRAEGLDTDVRGASAYSTLGWFDDPLLSTMLSPGDEALGELVDTVLHESVHATLHIPSEAWFNESLASFVADRLTDEYLDWSRGSQSPEAKSFASTQAWREQLSQRLAEAYAQLDAIYNSKATDAEKLAQKTEILDRLTRELHFRRPINNATLIQFRTYDANHDAYERLLRACGTSWPRFFDALRTLKPTSFGAQDQHDLGPVLAPLAARCAATAKGS